MSLSFVDHTEIVVKIITRALDTPAPLGFSLVEFGVFADAICHGATALRDLGFKETYVLKGGFKGLSAYLGPKQANQPLGPKTAAR